MFCARARRLSRASQRLRRLMMALRRIYGAWWTG
jgi:hypothetical protein